MPDTHPYEGDFHAWALEQAAALRRLASERTDLPLDLEQLAEEAEGLANGEIVEVEDALSGIILGLLHLHWLYEGEARRHREAEIILRRADVRSRLDRSRSIEAELDVEGLYRGVVPAFRHLIGAAGHLVAEYDAATRGCPWSLPDLLDDEFLPERRAEVQSRSRTELRSG